MQGCVRLNAAVRALRGLCLLQLSVSVGLGAFPAGGRRASGSRDA